MAVRPHVWTIRSFDDVKRLWSSVRSVPWRTEGREHHHLERHHLGLYLLALGTHRLLSYPFQVEQGKQHESPDFMVTWASGEVTGLEVTRATTPWLQRTMTDSERQYRRREAVAEESGTEPEPVVTLLSGGVGDEPERRWCSLVRKAVERKLDRWSHFKPASRYDLVVADDAPVGGIDRRKVTAYLQPWLRSLDVRALKLGSISVNISLDVLFDLRGEARVLPYVDWNAPPLDQEGELREFSDRIEYAGLYATELALQHHAKESNPVYSMDSRGRIVKRAAGGERFEVQVGEDGSEVVLRKLSRG
jgi:hypothetical protein